MYGGAAAARLGFLPFPKRAAIHPTEVEPMTAQVFAFPPAKHRTIVSTIVGQMRKRRSVDGAQKELADHLWIEVRRLDDLGISDDAIERFCRDFAVAAWTEYFADRETRGIA
jgi:hypothetical protein